MKRQLIIEIISFLYVLLFVYAALTKLMDVEKFTVQMGQSPLLMAFAPTLAYVVPVTELIIAVLLMIPQLKLIGLYAAFALMVMFTTYIVIILNFADHVPCSCGGLISAMNWWQHLIFNIVFILLAIMGIAFKDITTERQHELTPAAP